MLTIKQIILSTVLVSSFAFSANGLISLKSNHNVDATVSKFIQILKAKGMTVFTTIDHSAGAQNVDKHLRPTTVVFFGNPKVGTPLMQCSQTTAIDLPQKALIWQDELGQVWFSYNDPHYLFHRHEIKGCGETLKKISTALANFAKAATK